MWTLLSLLTLLSQSTIPVTAQFCALPNTLNYHTTTPQTIRSFQGVYGSNFNETLTFCDFRAKSFELNAWDIIPVLAQSADSGQSEYNAKGAMLTGGTYLASNGSVIWRGFGFSANGGYECAFALSPNGTQADGYYTFVSQLNGSTPAGETGPWILYYRGEPTAEACRLVYRNRRATCGKDS